MKIGILGASLETPNLGVSVLATTAVRCLLSAYPHAEVFFLDYARQSHTRTVFASGRNVQVPLVAMRFSKRFWLPNNIAVLLFLAIVLRRIASPVLRHRVLTHNPCLREIYAADLICSVAGGDSFSDLYGAVRFLYCALPQLLILLLRRPLVLLPQTYGPFRSRILRRGAQWIVRQAEHAWCRDGQSLADLMEGEDTDPSRREDSFCYDLGFVLESLAPVNLELRGFPAPSKPDGLLVGLNVSGLLYRGGYSGRNQFGLRSSYPRLMRTLAELLLSHAGVRVLLIPHVFGSEPESDVPACEAVYEELQSTYPGRVALLLGEYGPNEIRHVIGLCGFFVGSRMHACIAAVSQGIASVSIAYGDKFAGVMRTVGVEGLVADARELSQLEVLAHVHEAFERRTCIAAELQAKLPSIRARVLDLLACEPTRADTVQRAPIPA